MKNFTSRSSVSALTIAALACISIVLTGCGTYHHLSESLLEDSLALGTEFLLNNQLPEGNFTYEYDFISQTYSDGDSEVRQAGALWGLALIHRFDPSDETREAIINGLNFFEGISAETEDGGKYVIYADAGEGRTGTVALLALSLVDFLRAEGDFEGRELYEDNLNQTIQFLLSLRNEDDLFRSKYYTADGKPRSGPSPYFDGETLLALTKAAKYLDGYEYLIPTIIESADAMYEEYVVEALEDNPDSDSTKGFFQWGSMSFYEIYTSGWNDYELDQYADWTIELSYWMIDVHETLERTRNTGYAYEGIISARVLADFTGNNEARDYFDHVIDEGLYQLTSWQVGGPAENEFLEENPTEDELAIGGVMNKDDEALLRIDVTQHQMHAVILALDHLF
jgi:hypothetical protein